MTFSSVRTHPFPFSSNCASSDHLQPLYTLPFLKTQRSLLSIHFFFTLNDQQLALFFLHKPMGNNKLGSVHQSPSCHTDYYHCPFQVGLHATSQSLTNHFFYFFFLLRGLVRLLFLQTLFVIEE